ncbi:unnamed protein product [Prorocentrum cordatum]|uniref:Uncharacterized protein n=1 Tax=Prorocentrum cordatum TaxID=2364126 RepID=A0ABN9WUY9_9DINO|nr:unnamed protein product [Polarella glacialis]
MEAARGGPSRAVRARGARGPRPLHISRPAPALCLRPRASRPRQPGGPRKGEHRPRAFRRARPQWALETNLFLRLEKLPRSPVDRPRPGWSPPRPAGPAARGALRGACARPFPPPDAEPAAHGAAETAARCLAVGSTILGARRRRPRSPLDGRVLAGCRLRHVAGQGAGAAQCLALPGLGVSVVTSLGGDGDGRCTDAAAPRAPAGAARASCRRPWSSIPELAGRDTAEEAALALASARPGRTVVATEGPQVAPWARGVGTARRRRPAAGDGELAARAAAAACETPLPRRVVGGALEVGHRRVGRAAARSCASSSVAPPDVRR